MPIHWIVSQISQPVRIILIGAVVFLAAWFAVLRPKGEPAVPATTTTTAPPVSTPQTGLGRAVASAKKVAGQSTDTTKQPAAKTETGTTATTSAPDAKAQPTAISAVPAEALAKLPKDVAGALKARKVLVLGVLSEDTKPWRPVADDDRYVRNALKRTNRYDGGVVVKRVALDELSTYGPLVNDLGVTQSPSIVVIDRDLKGSVLTGYVDTASINQVIADARRNSISPNIQDPYLRDLNQLCADNHVRVDRWSLPTIPGNKAEIASFRRIQAVHAQFIRAISRTAAPKQWRGLKKDILALLKQEKRALTGITKAVKTRELSDLQEAVELIDEKREVELDRRLNKAGVTSCVSNRTA